MAALKEESVLYAELSDKYDEQKNMDVSEKFFEECIDIARKYDKRKVRFVLFKLNCIYKDADTGNEVADTIINNIKKIITHLTRRHMKTAFIIAVLECALEEI